MTRIQWDTVGERFYETGVDHGVLFIGDADGIPWNGLRSVDESPTGADSKAYYFDGYNYLNMASSEEYEATVKAFYSPPEFDACDGIAQLSNGLYATQQRRQTFGFCYRSRIGNDITGTEYGYKIHLVYNALAFPTDRTYESMSKETNPGDLSWKIRTRPEPLIGFAPSAHFVIDSTKTPATTLQQVEDILYGTDESAPRLPTPAEIREIFEVGELQYTVTRLTNPARSLLTGPWGTALFTDGARTVTMERPGWSRTFQQNDVPLSDLFATRTRSQTGWGTADQGGKWQHAGGTNPDDYSVFGGYGTLNLPDTGISRQSYLGSYDIADQTIAANFYLPGTVPTVGGFHCGLLMCRQNIDNAYRLKLEVSNNNHEDDFNRTLTDSWGTMKSGETWAITSPNADYDVSGGRGLITMSAKNSSRWAYSGTDYDGEVLVRVAPSQVTSGGQQTISAVLRRVDGSNAYLVRLSFNSDSTATCSIQKIVAGTTTTLTTEQTFPTNTYAAGTYFWIRAKIQGSQINGKVWKDGTTEPVGWTSSFADTSITQAGAFGVRGYQFSSNTNSTGAAFFVDDYSCLLGDGLYTIVARVQKDVEGVFTTLGSSLIVGSIGEGGTWRIEGKRDGSTIELRAWELGDSRPLNPQITVSDTTFTSGRSGVFAFSSTGQPAMLLGVNEFFANGTVISPAEFTTTKRVYTLDNPFVDGEIDNAQILQWMQGDEEDVIDVAMNFIYGAPSYYNTEGLRIRGDAHYGSRDAAGDLVEGSDFNDYVGVDWTYPDSSVDPAEPAEIGSLDCSGYVRMVFGPYGMGLPVRNSGTDNNAIPRVSYQQVGSGAPGVQIITDTGATPTDLSGLVIGDIVGFDATSNEEESGQIDHVGIYLGLDSLGAPLFVSSRKTIDGPTFSKSGGSSNLSGTGLYATRLRSARRF